MSYHPRLLALLGNLRNKVVYLDQPGKSWVIWMGCNVFTLFLLKWAVSAAPGVSHRTRMEKGGNYAKTSFAESFDNPLYRLPEQPHGGHRLDGMSSWTARGQKFMHH